MPSDSSCSNPGFLPSPAALSSFPKIQISLESMLLLRFTFANCGSLFILIFQIDTASELHLWIIRREWILPSRLLNPANAVINVSSVAFGPNENVLSLVTEDVLVGPKNLITTSMQKPWMKLDAWHLTCVILWLKKTLILSNSVEHGNTTTF
jgi:hypothetical protein